MKRFFESSRKASRPAQRSKPLTLGVESMEDRRLMTVSPILAVKIADRQPQFTLPVSEVFL